MESTTTSTVEQIATALRRLQDAVASKPGFGRSEAVSVTTLGGGVRCTSTERSAEIAADLPPALGGTKSAPSPGMHVRAALGACLAMRYRMLAAERGVELTSVRVTVSERSDVRGLLGDAAVPPGPISMNYHVEIESPADHDTLTAIVDEAGRLSPVLDALVRPLTLERTVALTGAGR